MDMDQLDDFEFPLEEGLPSEVTVVVTGEPPTTVEEELEKEEEEDRRRASEVTESLSLLDVLRISAIMEDIIDQLSILGYIMPLQYERKQSISQKASHEGSMTKKVSSSLLNKEKFSVPDIKQKSQDFSFKKPTKQIIMTLDILKKIQSDSQYFSNVITNVIEEMQHSGSFRILQEALGKERDNKVNFQDAITREEKGRKQIKSLQKQLLGVKRERQLQVQKLEEKLEFWMDKFDKDTEAKQNELNALKAAKATDLSHLQELAKMIREYEQVIIEDRLEKERTRRKMEQDELELKSIVKLQAWWRGTVIRREIGTFRLPRRERDDNKDSKGKEKEKRRGKK
ncbi:dynein regulatory complex protein 9 isoform X2 [Meriones unguiculatus]|uniref:dynein regulatory complex protein 9 isoform X2 n=1 Tax=Meriones unguiculatus TaxID=10047 RepID=UPI00293E4283|nr:dynein regulatory complex protein 9 isoform X2 [Meriones unguiculatus]